MVSQNKFNFVYIFNRFLNEGHNYGVICQNKYDDIQEYDTSKSEYISLRIRKLIDKLKLNDNNICYHFIIPKSFLEYINNNQWSQTYASFQELLNLFKKSIVIYL